MPARLDARTALLMTLPPLLWAGNAVVGRLMVGTVPPLTLNFLRWLLAAVILTFLGGRVLRDPARIAARWPALLVLGTLGVGAYNALQYVALVTTTPLNVTLIAATLPVWMLAIGALLHGVQPRAREWAGAALSLAGALIVISRGELAQVVRLRLVPGDLYILVAIIAWAFYSWMLARPPASLKPVMSLHEGADPRETPWTWSEFLLVQTLFGLIAAGGTAGVEQLRGATPITWGVSALLALAYVAIGPSIIAYRCWGLGVARGGPALAAFFGNFTPLFAALLSAALLGEAPHAYHAVAFALIVAGILVARERSH